MALNVGDAAPDFEMMNQDKKTVKLSELRGKKIVLLFYPMDFSPVCTTEHCAFGPDIGRIRKDENTVVFGISCDSPFAHDAFRKDYHLFMGELPFNCSKRGTVVISPEGKIAYWHEQPILEARHLEDLARAVNS
jgi:peroxiredoxin